MHPFARVSGHALGAHLLRLAGSGLLTLGVFLGVLFLYDVTLGHYRLRLRLGFRFRLRFGFRHRFRFWLYLGLGFRLGFRGRFRFRRCGRRSRLFRWRRRQVHYHFGDAGFARASAGQGQCTYGDQYAGMNQGRGDPGKQGTGCHWSPPSLRVTRRTCSTPRPCRISRRSRRVVMVTPASANRRTSPPSGRSLR